MHFSTAGAASQYPLPQRFRHVGVRIVWFPVATPRDAEPSGNIEQRMPTPMPQSPSTGRSSSARHAAAGEAAASAPWHAAHVLAVPLDRPDGIGLRTEWLLTDGRGGFAMGTACGAPTRRYHALFIAATRPPVGRVAMLNATVDQLIINPDTPQALPVELSSFRFAGGGDAMHPDGASRITRFEKSTAVHWSFELPAARITRSLVLERGRPGPGNQPAPTSALLRYVIERSAAAGARSAPAAPLRLTVRPLVSLRDFHGLIRRDWADRFATAAPGPEACRVDRDGIALHLRAGGAGARFAADPQWWFNFFYAEDAARGQDCVEDLFSPGLFSLDLAPGVKRTELLIRVALDEPAAPTADDWSRAVDAVGARWSRAAAAVHARAPRADARMRGWLSALAAAADDFVVSRQALRDGQAPGASIIAGYPWFSDWGRDTFISLPGLLLATGRYDEARATLLAFAAHRRHGLIPNVFDDRTGEAEYNTVDGSLWFIQAACAYSDTTGDHTAWREHLAPACLDIINHYRRGTDFNIAMDPFDKLITAGTSATQLTWMDARRDGVVFTPRHGKAVEVNALWISGLRRVSALLAPDDAAQAANLGDLADAASRSFRARFWNDAAACLFDVLTPSDSERGQMTWTPDASIRPNQIFAVSLPGSPLTIAQQRAVLACVRGSLLTPRGVRTLHPADSRYRGRYQGTLFDRDGAYHQGTAWPWLLGPLAEAALRVGGFSAAARQDATEILRPVLETLEPSFPGRTNEGGCPGHIAEIFDADPPQRPQGCPAQAWSIAEPLRVLTMIAAEATPPI
jgi:predicted glycogen debranching enzyme